MSFDAALSENDFNKLKRAVVFLSIANIMTWVSKASIADNATILNIIKIDNSIRISDLISAISAVLLIRLAIDWHSQPIEKRRNSADILDFNLTFIISISVLYFYLLYRGLVVLGKAEKQATPKQYSDYVVICLLLGVAWSFCVGLAIYLCLRFTSGLGVFRQYFDEWVEGPFETDAEKLERYLTISEQKFVFNPNDPGQFKILRFGRNNIITKNGNDNEFAWKISKSGANAPASLDLYSKAGWDFRRRRSNRPPYSSFLFNKRRLMWVMDNKRTTGPVINQYIIPYEAKKQK